MRGRMPCPSRSAAGHAVAGLPVFSSASNLLISLCLNQCNRPCPSVVKKFALRFWMWHSVAMTKPKIVAYLKPSCGWSQGVRAVLRKYDLPFEDRDIINDPAQRQEMIEKSGQMLSPCVEVDGKMLADISGDEV